MKFKFTIGILITAIISIFGFYSCEKDDICVDAVTPRLIVRFYDQTDYDQTLDVTNLRVSDLDGNAVYLSDAETVISNVDSILIPLKTLEDSTTFIFHTNYGVEDDGTISGNADTLTFNYVRNELYVSRACGYKVNYSELADELEEDDDNWIFNVTIENNEVLDETAAHVYIYH
ncbi:hypothetical protein SAMN05216480_101831 [Pustulibacterium marinum]|uniref:Uncharacterized protein n=1 Tax=Pustulibacterium marinum TaxID=1224947 RepID=A0A1I7FBU2_9FLAO|nr:DUF6452 family protein [Pustulibacterium marinum]SFU33632.1 hypothetical protein SAMN05216480_101831 [Pustulibacterium marinum]